MGNSSRHLPLACWLDSLDHETKSVVLIGRAHLSFRAWLSRVRSCHTHTKGIWRQHSHQVNIATYSLLTLQSGAHSRIFLSSALHYSGNYRADKPDVNIHQSAARSRIFSNVTFLFWFWDVCRVDHWEEEIISFPTIPIWALYSIGWQSYCHLKGQYRSCCCSLSNEGVGVTYHLNTVSLDKCVKC